MDKSRITKTRKVMSHDNRYDEGEEDFGGERRRRDNGDPFDSRRGEKASDRRGDDGGSWSRRDAGRGMDVRRDDGRDGHYGNGGAKKTTQRKERSLSPYSRRLALTQAMNISR